MSQKIIIPFELPRCMTTNNGHNAWPLTMDIDVWPLTMDTDVWPLIMDIINCCHCPYYATSTRRDQNSWNGSISASVAAGTELMSVSGYSSKFLVSPAWDNLGTTGGWNKKMELLSDYMYHMQSVCIHTCENYQQPSYGFPV